MEPVDLDVLRAAWRWLRESRKLVLVTVVRTWGSSPRPPGAMMAIRDDGMVAGSVSGGCIEDDLIDQVHRLGVEALTPGGLPRLVAYGVEADQAHRFGLPCGGTLELAFEPLQAPEALDQLVARLDARQPTMRVLDLGTGHADCFDASGHQGVQCDGSTLSAVLGPAYRLIVIGAGQLSRYLCQSAVGLGFDVTVCDPREEYALGWDVAGARLVRGMPDDVVVQSAPDAHTAIIALTHDPKLDDLAIMDALQSPAFYVGALGSRANHAKRVSRLREHFAMSEAELARLHGPAGIYIGSRTPPEIALSILAEIVAVKNGLAEHARISVASGKSGADCMVES